MVKFTCGIIVWYAILRPHKNSIRLVAVNEDGEQIPDGNLLKIKPDGSVYRYHTVNPILGLPTSGQGQVQATYTCR